MDFNELTPVRTNYAYSILVLGTTSWVPLCHYIDGQYDSALEHFHALVGVSPDEAFRFIERHEPNHVVIAEHYPDVCVYGPEKEPISWLEEGF